MQARGFFLGLSLLLAAQPLEAQRGGRGGGFGGHGSSGHSFGGHASARGSFSAPARSVSHMPAGGVSRAGWAIHSGSAQILVRSQPRTGASAVFPHILASQRFSSSVVVGRRGVQRPGSAGQRFSSSVVVMRRGVQQPASARSTTGRPATAGRPQFPVVFMAPPQDIFFFDQNLGFLHHFHHHFFFADTFGFPAFCVFSGLSHACFFQPFFGPRFFSPFFFPFSTPFVPFLDVVDAGATGVSGGLAPDETNPAGVNEVAEFPEAPPSQPTAETSPAKLAVLVLKDGWTYEVADYWVENGQLHYVTSYGGENAVPLEAVDFDQTAQRNWERGVEFVLRPKPKSR